MSASVSVAGRAALALVLMIGFYLLALAIAALLLYLPYAEITYAHRIDPRLALFCIVGAMTILWSILPRPDRFVPPGPVLVPDRHPRLFEEIAGVARVTGQTMPSEVFLVGDVNAWVAQRGGIMGFFSRRVMGIGLPLLQVLSLSEFRAVLAHEFGHFYGGDTRLGPWVHKTRAAIGRTIAQLGDSWLQKPFHWYGLLFLRISHAVSRQQEFSADALASRVAGARPLIEGLRKVQLAALSHQAYWTQEVTPVLEAGYLPPLVEGFRLFAGSEQVKRAMGALEAAVSKAEADPYDTHPTLAERIEAVEGMPAGPVGEGDPAAIEILPSAEDLARSWLETVAGHQTVNNLKALDWSAVVSSVLLPRWRECVPRLPEAFAAATIGDLATLLGPASHAGRPALVGDLHEQREALHRWMVGAATIVALDRAGWVIASGPGAPVSARLADNTIQPFNLVQRLANGELSSEEWHAEASRLGVAALPLVTRDSTAVSGTKPFR